MSLIITRNFKRAKALDAADAKDSARNVKYRGCEITVAYHDPDNVNLSGKTWIVKDVDGVSVGGFSSEAKAKAWIDAHPSRAADSRAADSCGMDDAAQDAKFQLAFAVGAIENAIERYSKTFSRYEDDLEEKDFKRYNAIFHAAVNVHRAIQSA